MFFLAARTAPSCVSGRLQGEHWSNRSYVKHLLRWVFRHNKLSNNAADHIFISLANLEGSAKCWRLLNLKATDKIQSSVSLLFVPYCPCSLFPSVMIPEDGL